MSRAPMIVTRIEHQGVKLSFDRPVTFYEALGAATRKAKTKS